MKRVALVDEGLEGREDLLARRWEKVVVEVIGGEQYHK